MSPVSGKAAQDTHSLQVLGLAVVAWSGVGDCLYTVEFSSEFVLAFYVNR